MNKKDIEVYEFEMRLIEEIFCLRSGFGVRIWRIRRHTPTKNSQG